MKANRIGEKFITNEGYDIEIVEYINNKQCTIKFDDGIKVKNIRYEAIKNGHVSNPNHKSLCNVGYIGIGPYLVSNKGIKTKAYSVWADMINRCYNKKRQQQHKEYINCSVSEKWHNFQNFAKWFYKYYIDGYVLDKDILIKKNKIYSKKTCCFAPVNINLLFTTNNVNRGEFPIGVCKFRDKFKSSITINGKRVHIGYFDNPLDAFKAYKISKESNIKDLAIKNKSNIRKKTYNAMMKYKVEIND